MIRLKLDNPQARDRCLWRLLRRRECWVPTWRGWLVLLLGLLLLTVFAVRTIHSFLAITSRVDTDVLVAEGWMDDEGAAGVLEEFNRGKYSHLYVTGGPLDRGEPLSEYKTYAELGSALLLKLGMPTNCVYAVPAPRVRRDRTFASAVALKTWLAERQESPGAINVISSGAHARRTRLLYKMAFGKATRIGIIAAADPNYDARLWWRSSNGFRQVFDESVAYLYAVLLFRPEIQTGQ